MSEFHKGDSVQLSMEVHQRVADLLVVGDIPSAIREAADATGLSGMQAHMLVKSMPEYQTGLNHRRETVEVALTCPGCGSPDAQVQRAGADGPVEACENDWHEPVTEVAS